MENTLHYGRSTNYSKAGLGVRTRSPLGAFGFNVIHIPESPDATRAWEVDAPNYVSAENHKGQLWLSPLLPVSTLLPHVHIAALRVPRYLPSS